MIGGGEGKRVRLFLDFDPSPALSLLFVLTTGKYKNQQSKKTNPGQV